MQDIKDIRKEIDTIDAELVRLLVKRFEAVDRIAEAKRSTNAPVKDPSREEAILARVCELSGSAFAPDTRKAYMALFDIARARESSH